MARLAGILTALTLLGLTVRTGGWERYLTAGHTFFDGEHYVRIAQGGYTDPALAAFYPLWPLLLRAVTWWTDAPGTVAAVGGVLAYLLFLAALAVFWRSLARWLPVWLVAPVVALYAVNPLSVFHALPFSESLCALGLALMLDEAGREEPRLVPLALWTFLTALARPIVTFLPLAVLIAAAITGQWRRAVVMAVASVLGYVPFGLACAGTFGDFFMPFTAQSLWHRDLGLHWQLIVAPHAVGGSPEVLTFELLSFYGPLVLMGLAVWRPGSDRPSINFNLWWAALFSAGHGAVAFLTYPEFMSLSRHVLCLPTAFYVIAGALARIKETKSSRRVLVGTVVISALFYVRYWARFARGGWIG